jgi:hypothetical protein
VLPTPPKPLPSAPAKPAPTTEKHTTKEHKPLPPIPARRPTVVSTPAASPISSHATSPSTVTIPPSITPSPPTSGIPRNFHKPDDAYFPGSCAACAGRIPKLGQLLLAGSAQYHPTCFACSVCATPITGSYQEHNGAVFCPRHPVATHAKRLRCVCCDRPIAPGQYLLVGGDKYHMECFGCKLCGLQFGTEHSYYDLWGGHICLPCYDATWRLKNRSRYYK